MKSFFSLFQAHKQKAKNSTNRVCLFFDVNLFFDGFLCQDGDNSMRRLNILSRDV